MDATSRPLFTRVSWFILSGLLLVTASCSGNQRQPEVPPTELPRSVRTPYQSRMVGLYVDCAFIAHGVWHVKPSADWQVVTSAEDVLRKADRAIALWNDLGESGEGLLNAVRADDADAINRHYAGIRKACVNCHVEYLGFEQRGYSLDMVDSWVETPDKPMAEVPDPLGVSGPEGRTPSAQRMRELWDVTHRIQVQIENNKTDRISDAAKMIREESAMRIRHWTGIKAAAEDVRDAQMNEDVAALKDAYTLMVNRCRDCHRAYSPEFPELPNFGR